MAEAEGRSELPIAPGQVYIEVEYDYEYKAKQGLVSIREGDCFMLVRKANEDWWQVRRDEGSRPFYVPAQYVREVRKALMPPPNALLPGGSRSRPSRPRPTPQFLDLRRPDDSPEGLDSPGREGPEDDDAPHPRSVEPPCDSGGSSEKLRNDSESGDDLSSSSAELLQNAPAVGGVRGAEVVSPASLPPLPCAPPLSTLGGWETHSDASGRHFYYNPTTQERTWKPPRVRDRGRSETHTPGEAEPLSLEDVCHTAYSSQSDSQYKSPPRGWSEELDLYRHTLCVCENTLMRRFFSNFPNPCTELVDLSQAATTVDFREEEGVHVSPPWLKQGDGQGRQYNYSADGSRSELELLKLPPGAPGDPHTKTRSLDRREPILHNKWRHSTCVLETNEKPVKHRRFRSERLPSSPTYQEQESPSGTKLSPPDTDCSPSSPKSPSSSSEKCGLLNVTKITELGRRVRKNWTSSWAVLEGSSLHFSKGQGGGSSWFSGGHSKPEFSVDLRGGSVDWASKDKSSKKHVLELKTRQGSEFLIHSENDSTVSDWLKALAEAITAHAWESDEAIEDDMPESPGPDREDEEKEHRDSRKNKDQKRTRGKLKRFLTRRPTLQAVKDKGYIKDQVFGCSLVSLCQRENVSVPKFVKMCIDHVENKGLGVDGLYRVSGNLSVIQKLRFSVNHDERVNLEDSKWEDIHVTTGALKMFFRELPEPLFTYGHFDDFISAIKCFDKRQRVHSVKDLIKQLPKPNHDTMQALFKHLRKVIDRGEENRMTTQSVAIVFGPTLLRPEVESFSMAVHMMYPNHLVELILLEYETIFGR